jgi:hypothetical protein
MLGSGQSKLEFAIIRYVSRREGTPHWKKKTHLTKLRRGGTFLCSPNNLVTKLVLIELNGKRGSSSTKEVDTGFDKTAR